MEIFPSYKGNMWKIFHLSTLLGILKMFQGIEPKIFDDPELKEDSVRELVIAPILARLGYLPNGSTRVTRSKSLRHPFIRVGTRKHPVTTIPDYTFYVDDKPLFVLDAKAPSQEVLAEDHLQQAYSYAIHPEIRCEEFGLCNGREIALFNTSQAEPLLHLGFEEFESKWLDIEKFLAPKFLREPNLRRFAPDFGLALKRMGFSKEVELVMLETRLNIFAKISDELMTASANCDFGSGEHCASFDFSPEMLASVVAGLPAPLKDRFIEALNRTPYQAAAGLVIELDLTAKLGELTQGQSESFVPLILQQIHASRFNPAEVPNDPNDIPPYVFKLREAFVPKSGDKDA
jgi:hypothetical protein